MASQLLSTIQAARVAGVTRHTILRWIDEERLDVTRSTQVRYRIAPADLADCLRRLGRQPPGSDR